jgi:hypothetical protein
MWEMAPSECGAKIEGVSKPKPTVDKDVLDLLTKLSELLGPIGGEPAHGPKYLLEALALFDRCRSMLGAIRLLLAYDFVHEAVALNRPLFADSLTLAEIAAAEEAERKRLVAGRELAALNDMEGILSEGESRGDDVTKGLEAVAKRRKHIEDFARKEEVKPRLWRPDDHMKALAEKHGRGDEYMDLRITHLFVHGSPFVTRQRYSEREEGSVEVGGHAVDHSAWANPTGLFAASSALMAARAACTIFGWAEPVEFEDIAATLRDELAKLAQSE